MEKPAARVLISNENETVIEFTLSGMNVKEIMTGNDSYHILRFPDYHTTMEVGRPQLPAISELIGIPDLSNVRVSVEETEEITLGGYHVYPYQEPRLENEVRPFFIERDFYENNVYYPALDVEVSRPGIWRDARIVTLKTYPVKYNPATGDIKIYRRMVVRLEYSGTSDTNVFTGPRKPIKPVWDRLYHRTILNYAFLGYAKAGNSLYKTATSSDYDYLIITVDNYDDNIQPLANWKTRRGIKSKVFKLSSIGANPDQTDIKNFIKEKYNNYNISYVLLVGDPADLPLPTGQEPNPPYAPTTWYGDFWYADTNNVEFPTEPELAVGRISAVSDDEVDLIVDKILNYELDPPLTYIGSDIWMKRSLLIADDDDGYWEGHFWIELEPDYQGCKENIEYDHPNDITFIEAFGRSGAENSDIDSEITDGIGLVNYRGHGSLSKWPDWNISDEDYEVYDAEDLENGALTPVVFSIACQTAGLQSASTTLGEAFLKNELGGAVAFLGATWDTRTYANHYYDEQLYNAIFDEELYQNGVVSNYAVEEMLTSYGDEGKWNARKYLWLGDPAMEIWTDVPDEITGIQITDYGTYIRVNVGTGPYNIFVCSGDNGSSYFDSTLSASGNNDFSTEVRPLYVTVAKHNCIPYTAVVGGTFTSDEYWFGDLYVHSSVVMDGNKTLKILPGTNVKMNGYYNLIIKQGSNILAEGTQADSIVFTSATGTSRQSWNNVFVFGSDNTFEYCKFEYGNWALKMDPNPTNSADNNEVINCTFYNNSQGLRIHENSAIIKSCEMDNNYIGLVCYTNTDLELEGNYIHDNDRDGIYSWNHNYINLYGNVVENSSSRYGIYVYYDDDIEIDEYNTVRDNGSVEIVSYYRGSSSSFSIYSSSIHDDSDLELYNYSSNNEITADSCWWGDDDECDYYGPVTITKLQEDTPTWDGVPQTKGAAKSARIFADGDNERIDQLKDIICTRPNTMEAVDAMKELYSLLRRDFRDDHFGEKEQFYDFLEEIYKEHAEFTIGKIALQNMITWLMLLGHIEDAIYLSHHALDVLSGNDRTGVLTNLTMLYISVGDISNSKEWLAQCKTEKELEASVIEFIEEELAELELLIKEGIIEPRTIGKDIPEYGRTVGDASIPEEFDLSQNYPNPGNPNTIIRFQLPEADYVILKIVNLMGQEVKTLVKEKREAGYYNVLWDGKNNNGQSVVSGIYLYTIRAGDRIMTRKLTLLK